MKKSIFIVTALFVMAGNVSAMKKNEIAMNEIPIIAIDKIPPIDPQIENPLSGEEREEHRCENLTRNLPSQNGQQGQ